MLDYQDKSMLVPAHLLVLVPHYQIQCSGLVSEWTAVIDGELDHKTIDLSYQVWRLGPTNNSYTLVGKNHHKIVYNTNEHVYSFRPEMNEQIQVQIGDIIGLYTYDSTDTKYGVRIGSFPKDSVAYYSHRTSDDNEVFSLSDHSIQKARGLAPLFSATVTGESVTHLIIACPSLFVVMQLNMPIILCRMIPQCASSNLYLCTICVFLEPSLEPTTPTQSRITKPTISSAPELASLVQYNAKEENDHHLMSSTAKLAIPVVAAILTVLLIVISLSVVGAVCLQVHKKRRSEQVTNLENPSYEARLQSNSYALHVTKAVPTRIPMNTKSDNRISEHDYESVSDADDYIDPVDIKDQLRDDSVDYDYPHTSQFGNFLDVNVHHHKSMKKQSAIYEVPHQFFQFPTEADTDEDYSVPNGPKNLAISPGYEVPMLKSVRVTQQPLNQ